MSCLSIQHKIFSTGVKARELLPKIVAETEKINPQDPLDLGIEFCGITNETHLNKLLAYISSGKQNGAKLITSGEIVEIITNDGLNRFNYINLAIVIDANPKKLFSRKYLGRYHLCLLLDMK